MTFLTPDPRHLGDDARREPGAGRGLSPGARFSRWDGSQAVPDPEADEILEAIADDVLEHGDLTEALRDLLERGLPSDDPTRPDLPGLRDLLERLRRRREELEGDARLGDPLADVRRELDEIVALERAGVERRLEDAAGGARVAAGAAELEGDVDADAGADGAGSPAEADATADAGAGADGAVDEEVDAGPVSAASDEEDAGDGSDQDGALREMLRGIAAARLERLDALPADVGGRIRALGEYDFLEADARTRFDALVDRLRSSVLDRMSQGLADAVRGMRPEQLDAQREMVRDLNRLLGDRVAGQEPGQDEVAEFLRRHGQHFPGAATLDDVVDQLASRMGALQSLLRSLPADQRAELQGAIDALLRDDRLRWDLAQLGANLDRLVPGGLGWRVDFSGDEPLGLDAALARLDRLGALDALEGVFAGVASPADLARIDRDRVRDLLGSDAARDVDALDELARRLEEAGYLERHGDRLELTARGSRRIGHKVLADLFGRLRSDAFGGHRADRAGRGGDREDDTKEYDFGDPFHLDLRGTLANALVRDENAPGRRAGAIRLRAEDFEVHRTERTTSAATVLLVDMSRSMLLRGCYLAAKRVALALDTLIRTQYPRDRLAIVGFAYYARELRPDALAELTWHGYEYGTNLQHGLQLARRILARERAANREIVVITDGEPTAHFEDGRVEFSYPPTRRTIAETLREVVRCTKDGITINTFMLERSRALTDFVALVTQLNRGRAFYAEPERLGEYVLVDFVGRRGGRVP